MLVLLLVCPWLLDGLMVDEKMFPWLWSDNPGPAFDATFFEEVLRVLGGFLKFVDVGLCDVDWLNGCAHLGLLVCGLVG